MQDVNHAVVAVGYGVENGVPYWLIKNSWGADWGVDGYFKMELGKNMCGEYLNSFTQNFKHISSQTIHVLSFFTNQRNFVSHLEKSDELIHAILLAGVATCASYPIVDA